MQAVCEYRDGLEAKSSRVALMCGNHWSAAPRTPPSWTVYTPLQVRWQPVLRGSAHLADECKIAEVVYDQGRQTLFHRWHRVRCNAVCVHSWATRTFQQTLRGTTVEVVILRLIPGKFGGFCRATYPEQAAEQQRRYGQIRISDTWLAGSLCTLQPPSSLSSSWNVGMERSSSAPVPSCSYLHRLLWLARLLGNCRVSALETCERIPSRKNVSWE